jgi:regulator of sirC expression with transglutaminase-like and TPR domain
MDFSIARQFFYQEIRQLESEICLERAALFIAQEEYPELEVDAYLNALETMALEVRERLPAAPYPLRIIQAINHYLYEDLGFQGNTADYYDPRNSFLNEVIDRRTGIPITLSLVYLAIAQRLDFPMVGVGMPGHFLIRPAVDEMEVFVDPFHQGEILFAQDCEARLSQIYQRPIKLKSQYLQTITQRLFLVRMLTNLKMIYLNHGAFEKALAAVERILLLVPSVPAELRDRGFLYFRLNRLTEAQQDLEDYLTLAPSAEDAAIVQQLLEQIALQIQSDS